MRKLMIEIDGERLANVLVHHGLSQGGLSCEMGYVSSYLYQCMKRGLLSENAAIYMERIHGIQREEYMRVPEKGTEPEPEIPIGIDYDELFKCIYLACYKAMQKALKEEEE